MKTVLVQSLWYMIYPKDGLYKGTGKNLDGGVLIAVRNKYLSERVSHLETNDESIWMKLALNENTRIYICAIYFPPNSSVSVSQIFRNKLLSSF